MKSIKSILLVTIISYVLFACDKAHLKKLAGNYRCTVHSSSWMMGTVSHDTTYIDTIEVTRNGLYLQVEGSFFHIDSVWKGKKYHQGNMYNQSEIQFVNDSLYFSRYGGGLGGGSGTTYVGRKID